MRKTLLTSLLLTFAFAACADHTGIGIVADNGPQAPINQPDTRVIEPSGGTGSSSGSSLEQGNGGSGGAGGAPGGSSPGSGPGGTGGASSGGEPGGGNNNPPQGGGGQGGSPVPEPGTLLLVGTGLAGLAGAALRRRQKKANPS